MLPQQYNMIKNIRTTEGTFVRDLLVAFNGSYLIQRLNVRRQTSMHTQYTLIDNLHIHRHRPPCTHSIHSLIIYTHIQTSLCAHNHWLGQWKCDNSASTTDNTQAHQHGWLCHANISNQYSKSIHQSKYVSKSPSSARQVNTPKDDGARRLIQELLDKNWKRREVKNIVENFARNCCAWSSMGSGRPHTLRRCDFCCGRTGSKPGN